VAQALQELPERVCMAFVLHRFEGLRHPEIASGSAFRSAPWKNTSFVRCA